MQIKARGCEKIVITVLYCWSFFVKLNIVLATFILSAAQLRFEMSVVDCFRFHVHSGERNVYLEQHSKYQTGHFGLGTDELRVRETLPRST